MVALACPPPSHMVCNPYRPPLRSSWCTSLSAVADGTGCRPCARVVGRPTPPLSSASPDRWRDCSRDGIVERLGRAVPCLTLLRYLELLMAMGQRYVMRCPAYPAAS